LIFRRIARRDARQGAVEQGALVVQGQLDIVARELVGGRVVQLAFRPVAAVFAPAVRLRHGVAQHALAVELAILEAAPVFVAVGRAQHAFLELPVFQCTFVMDAVAGGDFRLAQHLPLDEFAFEDGAVRVGQLARAVRAPVLEMAFEGGAVGALEAAWPRSCP
jgi:hypothetical protein